MRGCGDGCHVLDLGGAIIDVGKLDHRRVRIDRGGDLRRRHEAGVEPHHPRDALDDVVVGGKIAALGEDGLAAGAHAHGGDEQLEEVDRDRVGDGDLMWRGAEQRCELGPDASRRLIPASLVPRADQAGAPFLLDGARDALGDAFRPRAERIAIEIYEAAGSTKRARACASGSARSSARQSLRVRGTLLSSTDLF